MTIYQKIGEVRELIFARISSGQIKATGKGYKSKYFSLDDLVGTIHQGMRQQGLFHYFYMQDNFVVLRVINPETADEEITMSIPIPERNMKEMQSIGQAVTYSRRYLYYMLFDIRDIDNDYADEIKQEPTVKDASIREVFKTDNTDCMKLLKQAVKNIKKDNRNITNASITSEIQKLTGDMHVIGDCKRILTDCSPEDLKKL